MGFHWDVADFLRNWCVSWWFWGIVYIFVGGFTRISWFLPSWKLIWNPQKCTVFGTCLFLVESIEYNWIFGFVVVFKRHKQNQSWLGQCMMDHQKERNHGFAHIDIDDHPTWKKGAKQINTSLFPGSSQKFSDQIILPRDHPKTPPGLVDTEGVRDHVTKARRLDLPHVNFFDAAFEKAVLCWMRWWMERLSKSWVPALQNMLVTENFGSKAHSETNIRIWHKFNEETAVQGRLIGGDFLFAWREKNIQQK